VLMLGNSLETEKSWAYTSASDSFRRLLMISETGLILQRRDLHAETSSWNCFASATISSLMSGK